MRKVRLTLKYKSPGTWRHDDPHGNHKMKNTINSAAPLAESGDFPRTLTAIDGGEYSDTHATRLPVFCFPSFLRKTDKGTAVFALCLISAFGCLVTAARAEDAVGSRNDSTRKAAVFVANHADKTFDDKLPTLTDFISTRFTEKGFAVLSREVSTDALSSLLKDSKQTDADQLLSNNSSVLRLGQMLGADYLIVASISSFGSDKKTVDAYGVKTINVTHTLRVTYKIPELLT